MGIRQGCILSPDLFSLYVSKYVLHLEYMLEVVNINNPHYTVDTVLIGEKTNGIQQLLGFVLIECNKERKKNSIKM